LSASLEEKMNKLRTEIKIVVSRKMKSARLCLVCHEFMTFSCLFFLFISWTYESSPERNRLIMRLGRRASSRMEMKNVRKRVLASWPLTFPVDEVLQQALSTDFALALLPVQGWIGGIRDLLYEWRWWQRIESEKRMEKHVFDGLMNLASTTVDNPPKLVLRVDGGLFQITQKKNRCNKQFSPLQNQHFLFIHQQSTKINSLKPMKSHILQSNLDLRTPLYTYFGFT
jgi:hypothetical protein